MANVRYVITHEDNTPLGGSGRRIYYVADTDAGKPSSGLNVGDLCWAVDTGIWYVAINSTNWVEVVRLSGSYSWPNAQEFLSSITISGGIICDTFAVFNDIATFNGALAGNLTSGTYTPTRSGEINMDANVTMTVAQYMRVGNTVTVSGRFTADPTAAVTTSFEFTLPINSAFASNQQCCGVAFCGTNTNMGAEIITVSANKAKVQWIATDLNSRTWSYTLTYQIV